MAVAVDSTSPPRFTGAPSNDVDITSAAFTPPNNTLLAMCICCDTDANTAVDVTASDSLTGSWTQQIKADESTEAGGGGGHVSWWTRVVNTGASMTVSAKRNVGSLGNSDRISVKCYVLTGADISGTPVDTTDASNRGASTTNSISTDSVTPGANGLLLVGGVDYALSGLPASSDLDGEDSPGTEDSFNNASELCGLSGYKTASSGVGVTGNLDAAGAGAANWIWAQIVVREVATGSASASISPSISASPSASPSRSISPSVSPSSSISSSASPSVAPSIIIGRTVFDYVDYD